MFRFLNTVWASASSGFRIVSDTPVFYITLHCHEFSIMKYFKIVDKLCLHTLHGIPKNAQDLHIINFEPLTCTHTDAYTLYTYSEVENE